MKELDTTRLDVLNSSVHDTEEQRNYIVSQEVATSTTKVEIISRDEIYLIDEFDKRIRRICGAPLYNDRLNMRCKLTSGYGTAHVGFGRCRGHIKRWDSRGGRYKNLALFDALYKDSRAVTMAELYEMQPRLFDKTNLASLDGEIGVLTAILHNAISSNLGTEVIMDIIESLTRTKTARSKIEVDKLLIDVKAIKMFIQQFLDIAKKIMPAEKYSELVLAFQKELKFPATDSMRSLIMEENAEK